MGKLLPIQECWRPLLRVTPNNNKYAASPYFAFHCVEKMCAPARTRPRFLLAFNMMLKIIIHYYSWINCTSSWEFGPLEWCVQAQYRVYHFICGSGKIGRAAKFMCVYYEMVVLCNTHRTAQHTSEREREKQERFFNSTDSFSFGRISTSR